MEYDVLLMLCMFKALASQPLNSEVGAKVVC